jgi:hypothetical protein
MNEEDELVKELDTLVLNEESEVKAQEIQEQKLENQPPTEQAPPPSTLPPQQKQPKSPIKHPRSIDQFILDKAEEKKQQWIENAYSKLFAALVDNPTSTPQRQAPIIPQTAATSPDSSKQSNPPAQKQKTTYTLKSTLMIIGLFLVSGVAIIYLISRFI